MAKSLYLKGFNSQFNDFMNDLITVYPDKNQFLKYKTNIETLSKSNPSLMIKYWNNYAGKYSDKIENEDVSFFLEKDYSGDLKSNEYLSFINYIKELFNTMDNNNKEKTVKYVKNLTKLSSLYANS